MSSDDSGFDKEAEREKLREKYERDEADRENTRRMSELLLQGATMTGKHCNQCGDPIFRYDGQEFCPTCQQAAEGGADREQAAAESDERTPGDAPSADEQPEASADEQPGVSAGEQPGASADEQSEVSAGERSEASDDDRSEASDDEPRVEIDGVRVADRHVDRSDLRRPPSQQDGADEPAGRGRSGDSRGQRRAGDSRSRPHAGDSPGRRAGEHPRGEGARAEGAHAHDHTHGRDTRRGGRPRRRDAGADEADTRPGDLGPAREALVRTVTDLARRAEETDDATHARELLAATREAAEALAALDRANR